MATQPKQLWPTTEEYCEAIAFPESYLKHKVLKTCIPVPSKFGGPYRATGGFGVVFKLRSADGKQEWAVKCFTARLDQPAEQYRIVSEHLQSVQLSEIVSFEYLPDAFVVGGKGFPILKMPWCDGITLDQYIKQSLGHPAQLQLLLDCWVELNKRLRSSRIAHGDLQHGNVLVEVGDSNRITLRLVDFDGMFVPALSKHTPSEAGHPNYQHPRRAFEPKCRIEFDNFPALVIACALRALIVHGTELWKYNNDDNILFRNTDFVSPQDSPLFKELWKTHDPQLRCLVANLILACDQPLGQEPFLPDLLKSETSWEVSVADIRRIQSILNRPPSKPSPKPRTQPTARKPKQTVSVAAPQKQPLQPSSTSVLKTPLLNSIRNTLKSIPLQQSMIVAAIVSFTLLLGLAILRRSEARSSTVTPSELAQQIPMTLIPAGECLIGTPVDEEGRKYFDVDQVRVEFTRPFYMSTFEITQSQYSRVMNDADESPGDRDSAIPATCQWIDAIEFCNRLSKQQNRTPCYRRTDYGTSVEIIEGDGFRLPTEIEWEYACRAGTTTPFHFGDTIGNHQANIKIDDDTPDSPHQLVNVGSYFSNRYGLFDMHGNAAEWCWEQAPGVMPQPLSVGDEWQAARGGSLSDDPRAARSADNSSAIAYSDVTGYQPGTVGFRIVSTTNGGNPSTPVSVSLPENSSFSSTGMNEVFSDPPIPIKMIRIPATTFLMGVTKDEADEMNAFKAHNVMIPRSFLIGAHEVTQHQFEQIMGYNPSPHFAPRLAERANLPVDNVSWFDAITFCNSLSEKESLPLYYSIRNTKRDYANRSIVAADVDVLGGVGYRLPAEGEWELACRGETHFPIGYKSKNFHFGDTFANELANCCPEYSYGDGIRSGKGGTDRTSRVGSYAPNAFGLYDMHGNVGEMCCDRHGPSIAMQIGLSTEAYVVDPISAVDAAETNDPRMSGPKAVRGGSWAEYWKYASSASRRVLPKSQLGESDSFTGFRVARTSEGG